MTTWFTSDTHLNHARILELGEGRPFDTIEEHDEAIIDNWNSVVDDKDVVFHLGDVALGKWPEGISKMSRMKGHKIIVPGNHDRISSVEKESRRIKYLGDYVAVFNQIALEVLEVDLRVYDRVIAATLSHYPLEGDSHDGDRFTHLRGVDDGTPRIHGHTHCQPHERESFTSKGTPQLAVGVDAWDYTPVSAEVVLEWLDRVTSEARD